jgi:hypothetical protein
MLIGQSILAPGGDVTIDYFGPWFPRASNGASFTIEILLAAAAGWTLDVTVEHKRSEEPDSAAVPAVAFPTLTAVGTATKQATGLLELVRYKYLFTAGGVNPDWIHMRANPPIWQPN